MENRSSAAQGMYLTNCSAQQAFHERDLRLQTAFNAALRETPSPQTPLPEVTSQKQTEKKQLNIVSMCTSDHFLTHVGGVALISLAINHFELWPINMVVFLAGAAALLISDHLRG